MDSQLVHEESEGLSLQLLGERIEIISEVFGVDSLILDL
jgi:hypothetical protein